MSSKVRVRLQDHADRIDEWTIDQGFTSLRDLVLRDVIELLLRHDRAINALSRGEVGACDDAMNIDE